MGFETIEINLVSMRVDVTVSMRVDIIVSMSFNGPTRILAFEINEVTNYNHNFIFRLFLL